MLLAQRQSLSVGNSDYPLANVTGYLVIPIAPMLRSLFQGVLELKNEWRVPLGRGGKCAHEGSAGGRVVGIVEA